MLGDGENGSVSAALLGAGPATDVVTEATSRAPRFEDPLSVVAGLPSVSIPPTDSTLRRGQPLPEPPRIDVLGVGVSRTCLEDALTRIGSWVDNGEHHYVCVTGVHGVMESQQDPELMRIHNESGLTVADGAPLLWAAKYAGAEDCQRVRGPDFMPALCERARREGWSVYFYGGADGVPELVAERLAAQYPGLAVAGVYSPPFRPLTEAENAEVVNRINEARPDIVFVGLSTPKQERWMAANVGKLDAAALIGVGAAFDIAAGLKPQAPAWVQPTGLEWLYRMCLEPRRLGPRYLKNNPRFVATILRRPPRLRDAEQLGDGDPYPG